MAYPVDNPGEDYHAWSTTALDNESRDALVIWNEGQTRKSVNNSSRSELAAHAKNRNLQNGSIVTTGTADVQTFVSGVGYTVVPTGLRVLLKIGAALTNTGSATLNMDAIGAVTIKSQAGNNLAAGAMIAGTYCEFLYDGTNWRLLNEPIGGQVLLGSATAASSAVVDFTTGIDSTYDVYIFTFTNVVPATDGASFICLCSNDAGSSFKSASGDYYEGIVSINATTGVLTQAGLITQGAVIIASGVGNGASTPLGGELRWYAPWRSVQTQMIFQAGYNSGSAVIFNNGGSICIHSVLNAMRFGFTSGNIATGDFALYGVKV